MLNISENIEGQIRGMETRKQELLETSPYACKFHSAVNETLGENEIYGCIDPFSVWVSVYNVGSWSEATPAVRRLLSEGWACVRPEGEDNTIFSKTDQGFRWNFTYQIREGLECEATLNLKVKTSEEHDGMTCQRVKVGERTVSRVEDLYEIICPSV